MTEERATYTSPSMTRQASIATEHVLDTDAPARIAIVTPGLMYVACSCGHGALLAQLYRHTSHIVTLGAYRLLRVSLCVCVHGMTGGRATYNSPCMTGQAFDSN